MRYRHPDAYSLMYAVRCLDDQAAGKPSNANHLFIAINALTSLTDPDNRDGDMRPEMIDAREGLKQIAAGENVDDSRRIRQRTRELAALLLAVTQHRWPPGRESVAWTLSNTGGLWADYRGWDFIMHPVPRQGDISWRWIAQKSQPGEAHAALVRVDEGEAHSALAAELYMVTRADLSAK